VWRSNHNQILYEQCLIALGCAIGKVRNNMEGVKLNETEQLVACADDVNLSGGGTGGIQNSIVTAQEAG
jgi:hypothetical protein